MARLLHEDGVPTYSQLPTWNVTYPFWVISVSISEGYRTWWTAKDEPFPLFYYRGGGLLLTVDGQLIATGDDSVAVVRKGNPLEFSDFNRWTSDWSRFDRTGWARDNRGYWKSVQIPRRLEAEEWERRYDTRWLTRPADGRATSAALTAFLRDRRTTWPDRANL
ncbi:hypothetical protein ASF30_09660 [Leifsonia sp. Leaf264]|nr:hypothetical protein ASF30_09660 [Leifsonia sp. Leaf264]